MEEKILILDFGSQYTQLIARRLRELNIYCEIHPYNADLSKFESFKAVVLSGSPFSVLDANALKFNLDTILYKKPILGVCYGAQYVAHNKGGEVVKSNKREYGKAELHITAPEDPIFEKVHDSQVWMSHGDSIVNIPSNYEIIACTKEIPVAAYRNIKSGAPIYCLQFHPEVTHSLDGLKILENFAINIAKVKQIWTAKAYVIETVKNLKQKIGKDHVMLGLSGGVDSSVAAMLLHKAIGKNLHCVFINNGLLRKNEFEEVLDSYEHMGLNISGIDATDEFLNELEGVSDPETKRKVIGRVFIEIFQKEAKKNPEVKWLGQGTIYPDVIESVSVHGPSVTIKSHHNVGGLPDILHLKIVEPLRMLFKDEVRRVGREMGVVDNLINRHPFPGPGLSIRILGAITRDKIAMLQDADHIYIKNLKESGWYDKVWQAGAILLPVKSVGVMGDERTYEFTLALRCVNSVDGMTAEWSHLPYDLLAKISNQIINGVKGINRVVYDISTKPPSTIEWE